MLHVVIQQVASTRVWSALYVGTDGAAALAAWATSRADPLNSDVQHIRNPPWFRRRKPSRDGVTLFAEDESREAAQEGEEEGSPEPAGRRSTRSHKA